MKKANSVTTKDPDSSITLMIWCTNLCLGLSVTAVIGLMNSFNRFLVLQMMKSFRNIFTPPCILKGNVLKNTFYRHKEIFSSKHLKTNNRVLNFR